MVPEGITFRGVPYRLRLIEWVGLGSPTIGEAVGQALVMAVKFDCQVVIPDFNGVRLEVTPSDTIEELFERYNRISTKADEPEVILCQPL